MRDVLAVAAVIVVALGLGGVAAYMSVDLTPPGLDLIRPPAPAVVKRIERKEQRAALQEKASGCKYCSTVAELAKTFTRRAETARTHAAALKEALPQVTDEKNLVASRREELKRAEVAAIRAEEAAAVLTKWASRCTSEDFCKIPAASAMTNAASCASADDPRPSAALVVALSVRKAAEACASASCPAVDCQASAALKGDVIRIERSLDAVGGRVNASTLSTDADQLPVGASTFKAELTRVADETGYVAKMLPLLLDHTKVKGQLPKLAPAMIDERAVSAAQLAVVMEQAATIGSYGKADPRREAGWRLQSLAANLAAMGKDTKAAATGSADWQKVADSLGAALLDLARLQAMSDRVAGSTNEAGCDDAAASAAQQLREARAMLDLCRMRSACIGRGGAGTIVKASEGDDASLFERAQAAAETLSPNDLGAEQVIDVSDETVRPIEILRTKGVCRRAGDLQTAKAAAPVVTQAVAEAVVPPSFTPGTGAVSPQDLVAGAMQAALDAPPASEEPNMTDGIVEAVSRYSDAAPRFKPRRMQANDPALMQTAAPRQPAFQPGGVILPEVGAPGTAFGGEGGPTKTTPPAPSKDDE